MQLLYQAFFAAAAVSSLTSSQASSAYEVMIDLSGTWLVEEHAEGGSISMGTERWLEVVEGRMFIESYDVGKRDTRYTGTAAIWQESEDAWSGRWCAESEGCIPLSVSATNGILKIIGPKDAAGNELRETFEVQDAKLIQRVFNCSDSSSCELVSIIKGKRG